MNGHPSHARSTPLAHPTAMTSLVDFHSNQLAMPDSRFSLSRRSSAVSTSSSSTSYARRASIASVSLMMPSRLPLTPLGPQMTPAFAIADAQSPLQSTVTKSLSNSRQQSLSDDISLLHGTVLRIPRHVTIPVISPYFFFLFLPSSYFPLATTSRVGPGTDKR